MSQEAVGLAAGVAVGCYLVHRARGRARGRVPIVNDAETWKDRHAVHNDGDFFAFYSSVTGAITTRPELMHLLVHDHAIARGHAVFDTCTLMNNRLYRLDIHMDRLLSSAEKARIPLPFGASREENRERMMALVMATARASGKHTASVRYWLTAGTGHVGVTPAGCTPRFYVLIFGGLPGLSDDPMVDGISEVTVRESVVPLKAPFFAEMKSNNYLPNVLIAMSAQDRGGRLGIAIDDQGHVRESCVLNVICVDAEGVLRTPPFVRVLKGTTVRRSLELARSRLLGGGGGAGLLSRVVQEEVPEATLRSSRELILVAGDTHLYPIVSLDGAPIGDGKVGPVAKALFEMIMDDAANGLESEGNHIPL